MSVFVYCRNNALVTCLEKSIIAIYYDVARELIHASRNTSCMTASIAVWSGHHCIAVWTPSTISILLIVVSSPDRG